MRGLATFKPQPGPNYTFLRTKLNVSRAGDIVFDFGDTPKGSLTLWANQRPVPIDGKSVKVAFGEGEHWVFVGVNRDTVGDGSVSISIDPVQSTAKQQ